MDDLWSDDFGIDDVDEDKREPIQALFDGALESVLDQDMQADVARVVLENSLPEGYGTALTSVRNLTRDATSLYNDTKKQLKGPFDAIRKDLAEMAETSKKESFLGFKMDSIASFLRPEEEETRSNLTSQNPQDNAVDAVLNSIFTRDNENKEKDAKLLETELVAGKQNTNAIVAELNRLTSFQDSIQYNYMRKSLELQQRMFFGQQELVATTKAFAADSQSSNKALVKNTSLPDFAKQTLMEGYSEEAQNRIFGKVSEKASDYFRNFGGRLQENIQNRLNEVVGSVVEFAETIGEATGAMSGMGDEINPLEMVGGMGVSMAAEYGGEALGDRFRRILNKYPKIAKYGQELAFYAENYPSELQEALDNWDGGFPEEIVEKFPFLGRIRSEAMADELRALIPRMDDISLGISNNLAGDGATKERYFDEITRKSIIEIIPGFLSRILEQTMIFNNGPGVERVVYDVNTETFTTEAEAAQTAMNMIQGSAGKTRREQELEVMKLLNGGRPMDPKVVDSLIGTIKEFREAGKEINAFSIVDHFFDTGNERMGKRIDQALTKASGTTDGQNDIIDRLAAGQDSGLRKTMIAKDALRRINPSAEAVSKEALNALELWFTDNALEATRPKFEEMAAAFAQRGFGPEIAEEIQKVIDSSENNPRENDRIIAKAARETGNVFHDMQNQINRLYAAGATDTLQSTGIITRNQNLRGQNEIRDELMFGEQKVPERMDNPFEEMQSAGRRPTTEQRGNMDYTPSGAATAFDFWKMFTVVRDKIEGVPVHVVSQFGSTQPMVDTGAPTGPQDDGWRNNMFEMVERGFVTQAELLNMIFQKDLTVEVQAPEGLMSKIIGGGSAITSAGLNLLSSYTSGVYKMTAAGIGAGGSIVGGGLNAVGGALGILGDRFRPRDIYIAGSSTPVINIGDLKAGRFIDVNSGNPVRSLKDITGQVVDSEGNEIISAEDAASNLYDRQGSKLSALTNIVGSGLNMVGGAIGIQYRMAFAAMRAAVGVPVKLLNKMLDRPRDVFVKGEPEIPVLSALLMKQGGYYSENGTPITKPSDIDGQVFDRDGNVVLSHQQILRGLVDRFGVPIDANRAFQLAKRSVQLGWSAVKGSVGLGVAAVKGGVDIGLALTKGAVKLPMAVLDGIRGVGPNTGISETGDSDAPAGRSEQYLHGILSFMMERWPMGTASPTETLLQTLVDQGKPAKKSGDTDGDGDRDNSLMDRIQRRREGATTEDVEQIAKEEAKDDDSPWGKLLMGLSVIGTSLSGLVGTAKAWMERMFMAKTANSIAGGLGDAADVAGDMTGRGRKAGKLGKLGKIGKFGGAAIRGAKGLVGAAGTRIAKAVGGQIVKKGLLAAGGAVLGGIAAPALAAAGAAWTVWEIGEYFYERSDAEELEKLRFMQYGLDPENGDYLAAIRNTEKVLYKSVSKTGTRLKVNTSDIDWEEIADFWGVSMDNRAEIGNFADWIRMRVAPVLSLHAKAVFEIDRKLDLFDIDDEIDDKDIIRFLKKVNAFSGKQPLQYTGSAAPMIDRLLTEAEVKIYHDSLIAKYSGKTDVTKQTREAGKTLKEAHGDSTAVQSTSAAYRAYAEAEKAKQAANKVDDVPIVASKNNTQAKATQKTSLENLRKGVMSKEEQFGGKKIKLIKPCGGRLTSPFGMRPVNGRQHMHKGVDWADYEGSPIVAAADGIIMRREYSKSYGKCIYIRHPGGWHTRYAHLHSFASGLRKGDRVKQGDLLGTMGNTGHSRGVHLHFELRDGMWNDTNAYDPLKYIVNGSKEAEQAKTQERDIRKEQKADPEKSIEGIDTIETAANPNAMPEEVIKKTDDNKRAFMPTQIAKETLDTAQRDATNKQLANLGNATGKSTAELKTQTGHLETIANKQDELIKAIGLLTEAINNKEPVVIDGGNASKTKSKKAGQSANLTPVVNLGS
ncbi:glycoside hydrolase [Vibrio phage vB_pir03]|nr:glycoside hydrolase [Vibrio phage vB_pir03]